jgi:tetratricopeptide (TPR) repeat protein
VKIFLTRVSHLITLTVLFGPPALAELATPVGLITQAAHAEIRRAGTQTAVPAYKGDLLFVDDTLKNLGGPLSVAFCPTSSSYSIEQGEFKAERSSIKSLAAGKVRETKKLAVCRLPAVTPDTPRDLRTAADRIQSTVKDSISTAASKTVLTAAQASKLKVFDAPLQQDPADIATLASRAAALEDMGAFDLSAADYKAIRDFAPHAVWAEDERRAVLAQQERLKGGEGRIIGVVIGIAEYPNLPPERQLQFSDLDAEDFYRYLMTPRGGARPANVTLLENEHAQLGDIRVAITSAFARAQEEDTVVIFVAGHGTAIAEGQNAGAYILAYNSNPENLPDTAMRMEELQELTNGKNRPKRIRLFVDACNSGLIGTIETNRFNLFARRFLAQKRPDSEVLGLLASGEAESSFECVNFGHGAFSYFLLRGLNTTTAEAVDEYYGQVTVNSLTNYVRRRVSDATKQTQNPEKKGNALDRVELANKDVEGAIPPIAKSAGETCDVMRGRALTAAISAKSAKERKPPPDPVELAVAQGNLLPGARGSAFDLLNQGNSADRQRLLAILENAGQQIILQYLKGEESPLTSADFARCETLFAAATQLPGGGDAFAEGRRLFARGRRLIFDKNLPEAIATLQEAIRTDRKGAYSYNALGIAYLENAQFNEAIGAFQDAVNLAPQWAYARHNLALALTQNGQYAPAIAVYREAMRLGAQYAYIPFNLGLLYERLNRPEEARNAWQQALRASPRMARAWNGIGLSYFLEGRFAKAEEAYRTALGMASDMTDRLAVRHDLALLLAARGREADAVDLWRLNLKEAPSDVPSLIGLSEALASQGNTSSAIDVMAVLLQVKKDYTGGHLKYAQLLLKADRESQAAVELDVVLAASPDNPSANELRADLFAENIQPDRAAALTYYQRALRNAPSRDQRSRLRGKIRALAVK